MTLTNFQIDSEAREEREEEDEQIAGNDGGDWTWLKFYVVLYMLSVCFISIMTLNTMSLKCREMTKNGSGKHGRGNFESIKESIDDVAEAIREGNASMEKARHHVRFEQEVYAELVKIGVERHLRYTAYNFLTRDPASVRAFFGHSVNKR